MTLRNLQWIEDMIRHRFGDERARAIALAGMLIADSLSEIDKDLKDLTLSLSKKG